MVTVDQGLVRVTHEIDDNNDNATETENVTTL